MSKNARETILHRIARLFAGAALLACPQAFAQQAEFDAYAGYGTEPTQNDHLGEKEYSPFLDIGFPQRVFWGDTHVHTSFSTDAGMVGNRLGPEEAYRFARGETVVSSAGVRARLQRPLDFIVIADHAENLGLAPMIAEKKPGSCSRPISDARSPSSFMLENLGKPIPFGERRHAGRERSPQRQRRALTQSDLGTVDRRGRGHSTSRASSLH